MNKTRYLLYITLVGGAPILGGSLAMASTSLPPIGQRVYVLDEAEKTTKILPDNESMGSENLMRDPDKPDLDLGTVVVRKPKVRKAKPLGVKPVVLDLPKLVVRGNKSLPRLPFGLRRLSVDRSDSALRADFVPRVFQDARDDF